MSFVVPFTLNNIALFTVKVNGKPWNRAKEICKALEYGKATKTADIAKHLCRLENNESVSAMNIMHWPSDSRKLNYYINEERKKAKSKKS